MIDARAIRMRWEADGSKRDERGQRLFAASEARAAGWGGVAAVAKITGVSRKRIAAGLKDLAAPPLDPGRVRRKGGGRRPITETDGTIIEDLKHLVEPVTMGDPMRPLMWVSKSQEKLADELVALGHDVSGSFAPIVRRRGSRSVSQIVLASCAAAIAAVTPD